MVIGVFDSGVGGQSVARAIRQALPKDKVILREDRKHVPYGLRQPDELIKLVTPIFQELVDNGCQVIVVACNTVSTTIIDELKSKFAVPLIPVVPMVQEAVEATKSKVIAVCATPTTLASRKYGEIKKSYDSSIKVLEPDCSDWAYMIENRVMERKKIESRIGEVLDAGADVIVLGCTHYHWIEQEIKDLAKNRATILQPESKIIDELKKVARQPT
jgi:glutamate racemase